MILLSGAQGEMFQTIFRNKARAALVWLDDFLPLHLNGSQLVDPGPIGDRLSLRHRIGCGSFEKEYLKRFWRDFAEQGD